MNLPNVILLIKVLFSEYLSITIIAIDFYSSKVNYMIYKVKLSVVSSYTQGQ